MGCVGACDDDAPAAEERLDERAAGAENGDAIKFKRVSAFNAALLHKPLVLVAPTVQAYVSCARMAALRRSHQLKMSSALQR